MTRIGLLSDTHEYLHPKVYEYFNDCNEIWHAGDIGSLKIADELMKFKILKAVYGNIDDYNIKLQYDEYINFKCEEVKVLMMHIGGYPGKYEIKAENLIQKLSPKLFISGHSHILKVMYDKKYNLLHINPGAAGKYGFHKVITLIRFEIHKTEIKNMEILELKK